MRTSATSRAMYFNSRPSARGDLRTGHLVTPLDEFQFTPLREGRRMRALLRSGVQNISIHAPPRGATAFAK